MNCILIVEDEPHIVASLTKGLRAAGFTTHTTAEGGQAVALAIQEDFGLIILDIGLSGIDGFEVFQQLCGQGMGTSAIMFAARSSATDHAVDLEGGADDYMPRLFPFEEFLARIRIRLRPDAAGPDQMRLTHRDVILDLRTRTLTLEEGIVELFAREFALAEISMRHPDQVLGREQLLSAVWGLDFDPGFSVVEAYVSCLCSELGRQWVGIACGMGYRLT